MHRDAKSMTMTDPLGCEAKGRHTHGYAVSVQLVSRTHPISQGFGKNRNGAVVRDSAIPLCYWR